MAGEFNKNQFESIYPDGIENHYWNHARNRIILNFIKHHVGLKESILEIGGGRGVVAKFLYENGIDITSVELAPVNPVEGTEGYFFGNTDAFKMETETRMKFSVILLADVIEHFENPASFIQKIILSYPNVRYIILTVPARQELWTNYDTYNGHFRRYSIAMLKQLSSEIKFLHGGYFNHILYPIFWIYARLIRERETTLKAPEGWQKYFHRILSSILLLDYLIVPKKCLGTSCIGLFVKKPELPEIPHHL